MLVGSIYMYAGSTAPSGFLICDGSAVSRAIYADLYSEIGTTYGSGDGSSTFNLPDLTGRVIVGVSLNHSLGDTGGEETHSLLTSEIPSHNHSIQAHGHGNTITATTPKLVHSITQPAFTYNAPNASTASKTSSSTTRAGTSTATATRSTNLAISNHAAGTCTKTGGVTDCAAFDTETTGSDVGHSNMQPYLTITHIIYTGV